MSSQLHHSQGASTPSERLANEPPCSPEPRLLPNSPFTPEALAAAVREDMRRRWENPGLLGQPLFLEAYLQHWPVLKTAPHLLLSLILTEILLRQERADQPLPPTLEEYQQRFPELATALVRDVVLQATFATVPNPPFPRAGQPSQGQNSLLDQPDTPWLPAALAGTPTLSSLPCPRHPASRTRGVRQPALPRELSPPPGRPNPSPG